MEPDLPQGVLIASGTGYISGRPTAASSGYYTVTATGVNGAASTEVRIVITSPLLSGLRATYYNIADRNEMCDYPMLVGNAIQLSAKDITTNIDYEETSASSVWPNFPNDFSTYFYMEWEGYLRMETIGNWRLRITCDDGCKLIGADEQTLINHLFEGSLNSGVSVSGVGDEYAAGPVDPPVAVGVFNGESLRRVPDNRRLSAH